MELLTDFISNLNLDCQISLDACDIQILIGNQVLSRVNRLRITDKHQLIKVTDYLSRFWFGFLVSPATQFRSICQSARKLQTLDICLQDNDLDITLIFQLPQLTRLVLTIEGKLLITIKNKT